MAVWGALNAPAGVGGKRAKMTWRDLICQRCPDRSQSIHRHQQQQERYKRPARPAVLHHLSFSSPTVLSLLCFAPFLLFLPCSAPPLLCCAAFGLVYLPCPRTIDPGSSSLYHEAHSLARFSCHCRRCLGCWPDLSRGDLFRQQLGGCKFLLVCLLASLCVLPPTIANCHRFAHSPLARLLLALDDFYVQGRSWQVRALLRHFLL